MYAVGFSGITVTTLDLLFPLAMHAPHSVFGARPPSLSVEVRDFAPIPILDIAARLTIDTAWLAHCAGQRGPKRCANRIHLGLCAALIIAGLGLSVNGLATGSVLFVLFGMFRNLYFGKLSVFCPEANDACKGVVDRTS